MDSDKQFLQEGGVSDAAIARKQRFRSAKKTKPEKKYRLWFNQDGDITCFSANPDFDPNPSWLTYNFSQDELALFTDPKINFSQYRVDQLGDEFVISQRIHAVTLASHDSGLVEVDGLDHMTTHQRYYITKKSDPHILYETVTGEETMRVKYSPQKHSIYTQEK